MLIEDLDKPNGHRIIYFCIDVFITDEFSDYLKSDSPPIVSQQVIHMIEAGSAPTLSFKQLQHANSTTGVNILNINSGFDPDIAYGSREHLEAADMIIKNSVWAFHGFRLNEVLIEMYNPVEYSWAEGFGYRLCNEYRSFYERNSGKQAPGGIPRLYIASRDSVSSQVGTPMSATFRYSPPRLFFTPGEQELLRWAMFGRTDEELSDALCISRATVRKRWSSIYEKADSIISFLTKQSDPKDTRGTEKKRRLLEYLRHHMEELRPIDPKTLIGR